MGASPIIDSRKAVWPVPESYSRVVPVKGEPGSFWENRGDRFHCGIDIYAPTGSPVLAIVEGTVVNTGLFTHPKRIHYWCKTFFVDVETVEGFIIRYGEMASVSVSPGEKISSGMNIGTVGTVLNREVVGPDDPPYIQNLALRKHTSMLHLELRQKLTKEFSDYLGGNLFDKSRPDELQDPGLVLTQIVDR